MFNDFRRGRGRGRPAGRAARRLRLDAEEGRDLRDPVGQPADGGEQVVAGLVRSAHRDHMGADGGEGHRVHHRRPPLLVGGGVQVRGRQVGEPFGHVGGQRRARLGRPRAQAQRSDGAALADGLGQLVQPLALIDLEALSQAGPQALGQSPGLLGSGGPVGARDHRADVPQVDLGDSCQGRIGTVVPFSRLQHGSELLGQRQNGLGLDLGETLGGRLGVHALDGLPHSGHARPENLAGQRLLVLGQGRQRGLAMDPLGLEAGAPRPRRPFGAFAVLPARAALGPPVPGTTVASIATRGLAVLAGAGIAGAVVVSPIPLGAVAPGLSVPPLPAAVLALILAAVAPAAPAPVAVPVVPAISVPAVAVPAVSAVSVPAVSAVSVSAVSAVVAARLRDERGGDERAAPAADQLEAVRRGGAHPGREHRGDLQAVEPALGLSLEHAADGRGVRKEVATDLALGPSCPGGPPRPGSVVALARQLDL